MPEVFSTSGVGRLIKRPDWQVRTVSDLLQPPIERVGRLRAIPAARVAEIAQAIEERYGPHPEEAAAV